MPQSIAKNQHPFYLSNRIEMIYSNKNFVKISQVKNHKDLNIFKQNSELLDVSAMSVANQS